MKGTFDMFISINLATNKFIVTDKPKEIVEFNHKDNNPNIVMYCDNNYKEIAVFEKRNV